MKALGMRGISAYSLTVVRKIDRFTGDEAFRPHLRRTVIKPFLPGLIFVPDFRGR